MSNNVYERAKQIEQIQYVKHQELMQNIVNRKH